MALGAAALVLGGARGVFAAEEERLHISHYKQRRHMKLKLTEEQIWEIAENLDMGLRCFCHLKSGKIEAIPNFDETGWDEEDFGPWQEAVDKLEKNGRDYLEFRKMSSGESFGVMAAFAETVDDQRLRYKLEEALDERKPFRNFKREVDDSGAYRQKWFDFKQQKLIEFVKEQIELHNL